MQTKLDKHLPNTWGEGALFAFSGMDGDTHTRSGFVGTYGARPYGLLFHTPRRRVLDITLPEGGDVLLATGDAYAVETAEGNLLVVYSAWHSLVGWLPENAEITLSFEDGVPAQKQDHTWISEDSENGDAILLIRQDDRFALSYGADAAEAYQRAEGALHCDVMGELSGRLAAYASVPQLGDAAHQQLLHKCFSVMKVNTLAAEGTIGRRWSTPDRVPHQHMWLWDSVFHTFAMNLFDPELAWDFLGAMLDAQREDGLLRHMNQVSGAGSEITQPPIMAWGVWENYQFTRNRPRLQEVFESLERYLLWDMEHRDANGNGLLEWDIEGNPLCRSGESGLDNSPRFDEATELDAVDFSTLAAQDMGYVARIAEELGLSDKAEQWRQRSATLSAAVHDVLWDDQVGFYCDRHMDGRFSPVRAVSGFFPLLLDDCPADHVQRLTAALNDPQAFGSAAPVASVALDEPTWGTDMWRGGTWINTNYLVILGLHRQGCADLARTLAEKTVALVETYYRQYGVLFEFFDSRDDVPPPCCDRKGPAVEPYDIRCKMDSIRDYHWTAACVGRLLVDMDRGVI